LENRGIEFTSERALNGRGELGHKSRGIEFTSLRLDHGLIKMHSLEVMYGLLSRRNGLLPKNTPNTPATTDSVTPPRPNAMTGLPLAITSTGTIPKSSSQGNTSARHKHFSPSDHDETAAKRVKSIDGKFRSFIGNEFACHEVIIFNFAGRNALEKLHIDWG
jgi:hypothetical protein